MSHSLEDLLEIMRMLRDPEQGCPWDRKQNFKSIAAYTQEEVYEVIDAIEREDYQQLPNELGDLLFQVVFHCQLGQEAGLFNFHDVVGEITQKLLSRHPHVFPDASMASFGQAGDASLEQIALRWEQLKAEERARKTESEGGAGQQPGLLDDIPLALPALSRAKKLQKRAANVGFDWQRPEQVMLKLQEEMQELGEAMQQQDGVAVREEMGDILFTCVNLCRHLGLDGESVLRDANRKFESRFRHMEALARASAQESLQSMDADDLENLWRAVKKNADL